MAYSGEDLPESSLNEDFETPEDDEDYDDYWDWQPTCLMDCEICGCHGCIPDCEYYSGEDEDDEE